MCIRDSLKAFDLAAASTGLNEKQLKAAGIDYRAIITHSGSHASYYPGAKQISLKLLFTPQGKILGAQAIGADGADKRIDVIATATVSYTHLDVYKRQCPHWCFRTRRSSLKLFSSARCSRPS